MGGCAIFNFLLFFSLRRGGNHAHTRAVGSALIDIKRTYCTCVPVIASQPKHHGLLLEPEESTARTTQRIDHVGGRECSRRLPIGRRKLCSLRSGDLLNDSICAISNKWGSLSCCVYGGGEVSRSSFTFGPNILHKPISRTYPITHSLHPYSPHPAHPRSSHKSCEQRFL